VRLLAAALALAFCAQAQAQMFKCRDAAGKITYSSEDCKKIGLAPAGPIKENQVTVAPGLKPKPVPAKVKPGTEKGEAPTDYSEFKEQLDKEKRKGEDRKPRCFIVQTPMGTTTRCLDKADQAEMD
jgi:uncharacterized protein DUF4124